MALPRTLVTLALGLLLIASDHLWLARAAQVSVVLPPRLEIAEQRQRRCCDAIAIDPEGRLLATKQYKEVTLWDLDTGLELRTLVPQARAIANHPAVAVPSVAHSSYSGLAFDPSGRHVALTAADNVNPRTFTRGSLLAIPHVWEVETGHDLSAVDWTYDALAQRTVSPAFPFDPIETVFWQVTSDRAAATTLTRYRGAATTFSADGQLGISFTSEGGPPDEYRYRLDGLDLASNRTLWTTRIPGSGPPTATFSLDGNWVAIASWTETLVVGARTGAQVARLPGASYGQTVSFSRDSRRLVVGRRNEARVFDVSDWRLVAQMQAPSDHGIRAVIFAPEGRRVIAATGEAIHIWDALSGDEIRRISTDGARPLQALAISPQSRWLAVGTALTPPAIATGIAWPGAVVLWPLQGDRSPGPLWTRDDLSMHALAFSSDEERLAGVIFAEHTSRGGPQFESELSVQTLATSAHQRLVFTGEEVRQGEYDVVPDAAAKGLIFSRDGSIVIAAELGLRAHRPDDQDIREFEPFPRLAFYDARTLVLRRAMDLDGSDFTALAMSHDGKMLATGHDANTVRLWTATARQRGQLVWPIVDRRDVLGSALYGNFVTGLAFHPDGRRLAVARDDGMALVDVVGRTRREIDARKGRGYSAVAFSPDGSSLLYASGTVQSRAFVEAHISQWLTAAGRPGWTFHLGATEIRNLVFAPNGKWFAAATSGGVSVHNAATGVHLATLATLGTHDWLVWTPDGRYAGSPAGIARLGAVRQGRRAVPLATVGRRLELSALLRQVLP